VHFADLKDAVAVVVLVGERSIPLLIDRMAFDLTDLTARAAAGDELTFHIHARRQEALSRDIAEAHDLVAEVRAADEHVPTEIATIDDLCVRLKLVSPTLSGPDVQ
jgi:hypothetical protein